MKTERKIYNENGLWKFNPDPEVTINEIAFHAQGDVYDYCKALNAFETFRQGLNKSGQARKNALRKKSKQLLNGFSEETFNTYRSFLAQLRLNKIAKMDSKTVTIEFDGRKANNLPKLISGIEMSINVGGMSPQYYGLGFRSYIIN